NIWYKEMMKVYPKFVNDVYELRFDSKKSVYKLAKENTDNKYLMWGSKPSETDGIVQDLENKSLSTQKDVFENTYLIKDSLRKLEWRITDETRDIAGFECRKAVTKICDSVYVVAFYTDQIPVSSGPESFGGLPGLILGLAVPRLYTTWFATKLELIDPSIAQLNPVQKGKKVTREQLFAELKKGLKDWGEEGEKRIWVVSL
ncbi:MAG: GLPGLI family protein, partial [Sediminibacterium sp.]|nr:GLPGLI family protein [Sediminibacterium sp.]